MNNQSSIQEGPHKMSFMVYRLGGQATTDLSEDLTVKEVAYQLGFNDPFYFSNFFKKHTKHSPKSYQANMLYKFYMLFLIFLYSFGIPLYTNFDVSTTIENKKSNL